MCIFVGYANVRKIMTAHYSSKHGQVNKIPEELYMLFCDMRNFSRLASGQTKAQVTADYDHLDVTIQGFKISVRIDERQPYRLIRLSSAESPVEFVGVLHFEPSYLSNKTDFSIDVDANLNFMMKNLLGKKIQTALDKMVDTLVDISEGKMPDLSQVGL